MAEHGLVTNTMKKSVLTTSNPFERRIGYHRAVKRGPFIFVSGTTALKLNPAPSNTSVDASNMVNPEGSATVEYSNDAFKQALLAMARAIDAVERLGGAREDIARVRMFVARGEDCETVGAAFKQCFATPEQELPVQDNKEDEKVLWKEDMIGAAATMIVVPGGFVDSGILVEVEVDAVIVTF
ncbi:hypothetical protein H2198_005587 [Neophaeococcomyces mojaviensis]|uniref:Uncharacterized protein n=1 Tax=Neophaeococcomyces mojaviensis TaxID=3383035 RepID=A0ACC3A5D1_9EURO|nr:hypothetical protein H2198_005587 [Knufia sp. JES_112]